VAVDAWVLASAEEFFLAAFFFLVMDLLYAQSTFFWMIPTRASSGSISIPSAKSALAEIIFLTT
jgi:hypothetical protein